MLPKNIPVLSNLDIAVYMKTATEVGGDYYDFYLEEDGTLTAVIGDATGHGLNAGMMVSVTKGLFQSLASRKNPKISLKQFNDSIISMNLQPMYMSLSFIRFTNNQLQFVAAGMPPSLLYKKETNTVVEIESSGPPLGGFPNFEYEVNTYNLSKGDILLLLTDGFSERMNMNKQIFGWDKGNEILLQNSTSSANEIINKFVEVSNEWGSTMPQEDDITFVVIKVK